MSMKYELMNDEQQQSPEHQSFKQTDDDLIIPTVPDNLVR